METKRRNRLNPKPRKTPTGKKHKLRVTDGDVEIFQILQRYRYLPTNFIYELLPTERNYGKFQERLTDLSGHGFLKRPPQQLDTFNAFYKKIVYELNPKAKAILRERDEYFDISIGNGNSYHHEALTCLIIASIEIASSEFTFIDWPQILNAKMLPEETKTSPKPFNIPLIGLTQKSLVPDGTPFCIKGSKTLCFAGTETDMSTENLTGTRKVTIEKKFKAYLNIAQHRTYKKHFGFPNMVIPFVTTSEKRMGNMMKLLETVTNGKGCSFIVFKSTPHLRSVESSPDPIDFISGAWRRVGHPPFDLVNELSKQKPPSP
ncbi:MAG: hypothetical protein Hals2KO_05790 [Halioglobus sp.]